MRKWVEIPYKQSEAGPNGERIYSDSNVSGFGEDGDYHIWCRAWEGTAGSWLYINYFEVGGKDTD